MFINIVILVNYEHHKMEKIDFNLIDWTGIESVEYVGESGKAFWKTIQFGDLRLRLVEYSSGYIADHWCQKGHIVHCLEGDFDTELATGEILHLKKGMSYVVSDNMSSHKSISKNGVTLLIIDGGFLKL
jgi:hypothetical protein